MLAIGLAAAWKGRDFGVGSLTRMGPGFLPVTLGLLLAGLGLAIALMAFRPSVPVAVGVGVGVGEDMAAETDWRGVLCILAGMGGFIVVGHVAGLIPASLVCVFVSALGDRTATLRSSAILATCVAAACTLVFHYGLGIRFPLFGGG